MFTANYNKRKLLLPVLGGVLPLIFFSAHLMNLIFTHSGTLTNYLTTIIAIAVLTIAVVRVLKMYNFTTPVLIMDEEGIDHLPFKKGILKLDKIKWKDIESATPREVTIKLTTLHIIEIKLKNEANLKFNKSRILYSLYRGSLGLHCTLLDKTMDEIFAFINYRI